MNAAGINVIKASAGTGKTTTLIKRVLGRILDDDPEAERSVVSRILIITFTVAAADDVRRKIGESIEHARRYAADPGIGDPRYLIGGDDGPIAAALKDPDRRDRNMRVLGNAGSALPAMQISTIDAFSKRIVDRNADALAACGATSRITPGYELLADGSMRDALRSAVLDPLMQDWYRTDSPRHDGLSELLEEFGGAAGDAGLKAEVLALYDVAQAQADPDAWIDRIPLLYAARQPLSQAVPAFDGVSPFVDRLVTDTRLELSPLLERLDSIRQRAESMVSDYDAAQKAAKEDGTLKGKTGSSRLKKALSNAKDTSWTAKFWEPAGRWYGMLSDALSDGSWDTIRGIVWSMETRRGVTPPQDLSIHDAPSPMRVPSGQNPAGDLCTVGDEEFEALGLPWRPSELAGESRDLASRASAFNERARSRFSAPATEIDALNDAAFRRLSTLGDLTKAFARRYELRKAEDAVAEYADVQRAALQLVRLSPSVARQVSAQWRYAYVDESQDNSPMQNDFVDALKAAGIEVTMVGDIKQSIYAFRNASPDGFERICSAAGANAERLLQNFRSNPEIVDFTNMVFDSVMDAALGGVDYSGERLELGSSYIAAERNGIRPKDQSSVELLCRTGDAGARNAGDPDPAPLRSSGPQQQVDMIVRRVRRLLGERLPADARGESRPIRQRDIMILARSKTHFGDLERALRREGIAVRVEGVGEYFVKAEIVIALDWLRIIDNPEQDVPLVAVLRSIGFTNDQLAAIRLAKAHGSFHGAMVAAAGGNDETSGSVRSFLSRLGELHDYASWHPIASTLWRIYARTGWYDYVGDLPQGGQRQANLVELAGKAETFESGSGRGIPSFVRAVDAWANDREANEETSALDSDDAVRIMTIHKSKGLQSPVVILMDASDPKVNAQKLGGAVLHDMLSDQEDAGLGTCAVQLRDTGLMLKRETAQWRWLRDVKFADAASESLRLLYVALTRAESKLIVAGRTKAKLDGGESGRQEESAASRFLSSSGYPSRGCPTPLLDEQVRLEENFMILIVQSLIHAAGGLDRARLCVVDDRADGTGQSFRMVVPGTGQRRHGGAMRDERIVVDVRLDAAPLASEPEQGRTDAAVLATRPRLFLAKREADHQVRIPLGLSASGAERWAREQGQGTEEPAGALPSGLAKPDFMSEGDAAAAPTEIGTAVHAALELYDWASDQNGAECGKAVDQAFDWLGRIGLVRPPIAAQAKSRFRDGVIWFVRDSKLATGIRAHSGALHREEPFALLIGAADLLSTIGRADSSGALGTALSSANADGIMVVRGIIDGYYVDEDRKRIVLFDYKTDALREEESVDAWGKRLHDDYFGQQALYALALRQMYGDGYRTDERWLVGLSGKRLIDVSH